LPASLAQGPFADRHDQAGLAVGFWDSVEEIAAQWQCERRFEPRMAAGRRAELMAQWGRAVARSRDWAQPG
ncbi:MAG: hypothetical protein V4462_17365, partial [Pseudomonadota bacterium]